MSNDSIPNASNTGSKANEPSYQLHRNTREIIRAHEAGINDQGERSHPSLLLFSNERIKVSDFRIHPSQRVEIKHDHPTIRWQVAYDGTVEHQLEILRSKEGGEVSAEVLSGIVTDRFIFYTEADTVWKLTNTSPKTEYRQIVFEVLSDEPKYTEEKVNELFEKALYSTNNVGTNLLFENHLCRCWDFYLDPDEGGGADTVHHHCLDYVFINIAPSRLLGLHPQTLSLNKSDLLFDSVSEDNQVTWNTIPEDAATDINHAHGGKNGYSDRPMREYLVELK